jgi:hypothetical protein
MKKIRLQIISKNKNDDEVLMFSFFRVICYIQYELRSITSEIISHWELRKKKIKAEQKFVKKRKKR